MKKILLIISMLGLLSACAEKTLKTDATVYRAADFQSFETWRWSEWEQDDSVNEIMQSHIQSKIESELTDKKFKQTSEGTVDFLVNYIVNVRDDIEVDKLPKYEGFSERYVAFDRHGRFVNVAEFQMRKDLDSKVDYTSIVKGTLIIDILEPNTKKLLMRMIAEKPLPEKKVSADVRRQRVDEVIEDLLSNFPPESPNGK